MTRTLLIAGLAVVLAFAPLILPAYQITLLNYVGLGSIVALGLVLMTGIGGVTSFGQAAFMGIGAYVTAVITTGAGWSPWVTLPLALLVTGLVAYAIGLMTLHLSGHFLPLSTIAWSISLYYLAGNLAELGGHNGIDGLPTITFGTLTLSDASSYYYLIWVFAGLALLATHNLLASRTGRAIRCLRGRSLVAESFGADTAQLKIFTFVYAAILAALAGWLYAHLVRFVNPTPFGLNASIEYLFMAVLGGVNSIWGAVVGAGLLTLIRDRLQDILPNLVGSGGAVETITFGLMVVLLLQWSKSGIASWFSTWLPREAAMSASPGGDALPVRARDKLAQTILEVRDVSRLFGGLVALDKVSFALQSGEILGLIGPNGAGKSTLFDIITGVTKPSGGEVLFNDGRIDGEKARNIARLGIARTFQHVKVRSDMSVIENVAVGAYLRSPDGPLRSIVRLDRAGEAALGREAARVLERVGLQSLSFQSAGSISLGQQRLVEIARALAADPYLLLLDEPAAGLRWGEKRALSALLRQLKTEGVTILIVEHDMRFVMSLVDRVVVLNFGRKIADGLPENVRANDAVLKAYLGTAHEIAV